MNLDNNSNLLICYGIPATILAATAFNRQRCKTRIRMMECDLARHAFDNPDRPVAPLEVYFRTVDVRRDTDRDDDPLPPPWGYSMVRSSWLRNWLWKWRPRSFKEHGR